MGTGIPREGPTFISCVCAGLRSGGGGQGRSKCSPADLGGPGGGRGCVCFQRRALGWALCGFLDFTSSRRRRFLISAPRLVASSFTPSPTPAQWQDEPELGVEDSAQSRVGCGSGTPRMNVPNLLGP